MQAAAINVAWLHRQTHSDGLFAGAEEDFAALCVGRK
jgi:hypothetical protein